MAKRTRGFIGPLGDDIPSIFPIVIGLTLFFAGFAFGVTRYNERTTMLEERRTGLSISYSIMERGFVESDTALHPNLDELCQRAKDIADKNRLYVALSVQDAFTYVGSCNTPDCVFLNTAPFSSYGSGITKCVSDVWNSTLAKGDSKLLPRNYVSYSYPIAIPCADATCKTYQPGLINIIMWNYRPVV